MRRILIGVAIAAALHAAFSAAAGRQEPFPHARHDGLFPLCDGCHGAAAEPIYPEAALCTRCHDGVRERRVTWEGPSAQASNLRFSHAAHRAATDTATTVQCRDCHGTGDGRHMAVGPARAGACLTCHAHSAPDHLDPARDCLVCHLPLTQAKALDARRIAEFPKPATHEAPAFAAQHGRAASDASRCSVCHARETCTVCHANDAAVPAIAALDPDARVAGLVRGRSPAYPAPASHRSGEWDVLHGTRAEAAIGSCANCHMRESCATCHEAAPSIAARLPARGPDDRRGVQVARRTTVHVPGYAGRHAADAVAREAACSACHERERCQACHTAGTTPSFHQPDFLATHGPAAYAAETECVSCHSTEVFCRSCHVETGRGARDRLGLAFHTANPFWLFGHGVAARQGLETCATCHAEQSCMRCHSATGSWRINPHGPGFDARRAQQANPVTCRLCHRGGVGG